MCANLSLIFVVFCCVSSLYSALCINDHTKYSKRYKHKNAWRWVPGEVVNKVTIDGKEIVFRVVSGSRAVQGEFPYIVSFRKQFKKTKWFPSFCGATIISPHELLSAAHCFRKSNWLTDSCCRHSGRAAASRINGVYAVAGSLHAISHFHGDEDSTENGQWRTLRLVVFPTDYNFPKHDIAVVFLDKPFTLSDIVKTLPYAATPREYKGTCVLSGYGRVNGGHRSKFLRKAYLRLLDSNRCNWIHQRDMSKFICTSEDVGDSSQGDSGGPLVCSKTGDPKEGENGILVGVVSGGMKDLKDGSFYTRVTSYIEFIEEKRKNNIAARPLASTAFVVLSSVLSCSFYDKIII